jgi:diadenosine tetraphosphate (Ap4A) HIT family hydrolase
MEADLQQTEPGCPFCVANGLLQDGPLFANERFYFLASVDPELPIAGMIIPHRHSASPFELTPEEFAALPDMLARARRHFLGHTPDGFTVGWNVGRAGGQEVFHTHLHLIPRFAHAPDAGVGIRRVIKYKRKEQEA